MNIQTIFIGAISLLWITVGSWYVGNLPYDGTADLAALSLKNADIELKSEDHFKFELSSDEMTLGPSTRSFFADVANYLKNNSHQELTLMGLYLSEELNHSEYINLGEARASAVKNLIVKLGAPKDQIRIESQTLIINPMRNDYLYDIVGFQLNVIDTLVTTPFDATDETASLAVEYVEPMTLFGDAIYDLENTPSMQHYIEKISAYLSEHEEAKLQIIGHTHELGSIVKNKDRSREVANRVKRFFRNNGIHYKRIDPQSRGATEPIIAPGNPQAKEKNNRVEIRIIE